MAGRDRYFPPYTNRGQYRPRTAADRLRDEENGRGYENGRRNHQNARRNSGEIGANNRPTRKRSRDQTVEDGNCVRDSNKRHEGPSGRSSATSHQTRQSSNASPVNQGILPPGLRTNLSDARVNSSAHAPAASAPVGGNPIPPNRPRRDAVTGLRTIIPRESPMQNEFRPGVIVTAPHHVTALDTARAYNTTDRHFVQTAAAAVCSKRRMMIILWSHPTHLFALPMGSHHDNGLASIEEKKDRRNEYLCLKKWNEDDFVNQGNPEWEPIVVTLESGGSDDIVNLREDIRIVGQIKPEDAKRLRDLWTKLANKAVEVGAQNQVKENTRLQGEAQRAAHKAKIEAEIANPYGRR